LHSVRIAESRGVYSKSGQAVKLTQPARNDQKKAQPQEELR